MHLLLLESVTASRPRGGHRVGQVVQSSTRRRCAWQHAILHSDSKHLLRQCVTGGSPGAAVNWDELELPGMDMHGDYDSDSGSDSEHLTKSPWPRHLLELMRWTFAGMAFDEVQKCSAELNDCEKR